MTKVAQDYIERNFPCEGNCDSWGVCDNCCEKAVFLAGYSMGAKSLVDYGDCSTPTSYCSNCSCGKKEALEGK